MSLAGRGVVLTRPRELAEPFARTLESWGARAIVFPAIEIQPLAPPSAPCPGAGKLSSIASRAVMRAVRPRRTSPATASTMAS